MPLLQKLPGSRRQPHGLEWRIAKKLPWVLLGSTAIPALCFLYAVLFPDPDIGDTIEKYLSGVAIAAVAATLTINGWYGAGFMPPGTGIILNNEMDDFVAKTGVPNAFGLLGGEANSIAAGKRPLSSMTPTIVLDDGKPWFATGSPGGSRIITSVLQMIVNMIDHEMNLAEATAAPRRRGFEDWILSERYAAPVDVGDCGKPL